MLIEARGSSFRKVFTLAAVLGLICGCSVPAARAQQPVIEKLVLDGTIQPVSAGMLDRALVRCLLYTSPSPRD